MKNKTKIKVALEVSKFSVPQRSLEDKISVIDQINKELKAREITADDIISINNTGDWVTVWHKCNFVNE